MLLATGFKKAYFHGEENGKAGRKGRGETSGKARDKRRKNGRGRKRNLIGGMITWQLSVLANRAVLWLNDTS